MSKFAKPADLGFMGNHFGDSVSKVAQLEKERKLPRAMFDHAKVVKDAMEIFNWWSYVDPEAAHDTILSNYEGIFFAGNKVLKKNVEVEVAWFNALKDVCKAMFDFLSAREENIWMWSGKDSGDAADFFNKQLAAGPGETAQAAPKEEKKAEEKPKPVVKAAPAKKAVKPPSMVENLMRKEWVIENYREGTVTLNEESYHEETAERTPGCTYQHTLKIFDCQKTTFIVNGKIKNIMLDNCKNCQIVVQSVVTGVEMSKCNTCKIQGIENLPFVNIEQSIETKLFLTHKTKNCKIQMMCARSINVRFPKEGVDDQSQEDEDWVTQVIPEVFETVIDYEKAKCITTPVEYGDE